MSIHITGTGKRFGVSAALVALALAVAAIVLATQASSLWSTRTVPQVQPGQTIEVPPTNAGLAGSSHVGIGCRPKYGCGGLVDSDHTRPGCRPKYGCENDAGTAGGVGVP